MFKKALKIFGIVHVDSMSNKKKHSHQLLDYVTQSTTKNKYRQPMISFINCFVLFFAFGEAKWTQKTNVCVCMIYNEHQFECSDLYTNSMWCAVNQSNDCYEYSIQFICENLIFICDFLLKKIKTRMNEIVKRKHRLWSWKKNVQHS